MTDLLGNNKLSSSEMFYWRDKYRNVISNINTIDLWYEDPLYGKVDHRHTPIYPNEYYLSQLQSTKTIFVVNFVADAWTDFKKHINSSVMAGEISKDSFYSLSSPQTGWENINNYYHNWMATLYEVFVDTFIDEEMDKKITNFKEFINVYLEFVDKMSKDFPFTKESLILSRWCTPRVSGLIIEIAEGAHDADAVKLKFLTDSSYPRVVTIAKEYGFKIDKNAPWRFVADLDSVKMKSYMAAYELENKEEAFDGLYFRAYESSFDVFKYYIWQWYDDYVNLKPTIHAAVSKTCKSLSVTKNREAISKEEAMDRFSDQYWLRLYTYIFAKEMKKPWKQSEFNAVVKKASSLSDLKNGMAGLAYISHAIKEDKKNDPRERNNYTEEENNAILEERRFNKGKGTFKF